MMNDEWWMMKDEWSMINDQWWKMNDKWWMMNDQWPMINDERWMMNDKWWMINYQQWMTKVEWWKYFIPVNTRPIITAILTFHREIYHTTINSDFSSFLKNDFKKFIYLKKNKTKKIYNSKDSLKIYRFPKQNSEYCYCPKKKDLNINWEISYNLKGL